MCYSRRFAIAWPSHRRERPARATTPHPHPPVGRSDRDARGVRALCRPSRGLLRLSRARRPFPASPAAAETPTPRVDRAALAAAVNFDPKSGADGVALDAPIAVAAGSGNLFSVRVRPRPVGIGQRAADRRPRRGARDTRPLLPGTQYRIIRDGVGTVGRTRAVDVDLPHADAGRGRRRDDLPGRSHRRCRHSRSWSASTTTSPIRCRAWPCSRTSP